MLYLLLINCKKTLINFLCYTNRPPKTEDQLLAFFYNQIKKLNRSITFFGNRRLKEGFTFLRDDGNRYLLSIFSALGPIVLPTPNKTRKENPYKKTASTVRMTVTAPSVCVTVWKWFKLKRVSSWVFLLRNLTTFSCAYDCRYLQIALKKDIHKWTILNVVLMK